MEKNPNKHKYYETLHSEMVEMFKSFTVEEYRNISLMLRNSIERLESDLFDLCSESYKEEYVKFVTEKTKFKSVKINKKQQNQIGFVSLELEEKELGD